MLASRRVGVGVQLDESALKHALHAQTPPTHEVSFSSGLVWRHPCFLDALAAEFVSPSCVAQQAAQLASLRQNDGLGLAMPFEFVAELLQDVLPTLPPALASRAQPALHALRVGARLSRLVPVSSGNRKALLGFLKELVGQLRALPIGGAILLPVGWAAPPPASKPETPPGPGACSVVLALRRDDASSWSLAVCTASDGSEYHPQYPVPLRSSANFDPCLFLRGIPKEKVLDSAVWALLYRAIAPEKRHSSARTLYEVVLPFFHERPLPASLAAWPPPRLFRRARAAGGDASRTAAALESVGALVLLAGAEAAAACMLRLQLRGAALRGVRSQLGVLQASVAGEAASVSAAEHELIEAACRGMARHAAAHAAVAEEEGAAPAAALLALARTVKDCREAADAMRARGAGFVPPKVSLPSAAECRAATQLPLFGRMRRDGDVEFHAGTPPPPPFLRPLSLSAVPGGVSSPHEVAAAMQRAVHECTLLANQADQARCTPLLTLQPLYHAAPLHHAIPPCRTAAPLTPLLLPSRCATPRRYVSRCSARCSRASSRCPCPSTTRSGQSCASGSKAGCSTRHRPSCCGCCPC